MAGSAAIVFIIIIIISTSIITSITSHHHHDDDDGDLMGVVQPCALGHFSLLFHHWAISPFQSQHDLDDDDIYNDEVYVCLLRFCMPKLPEWSHS